jgi:hypothetical protein
MESALIAKLMRLTETGKLKWGLAGHPTSSPAAFEDYVMAIGDKIMLHGSLYARFNNGYFYVAAYCLKKDAPNAWCSHGFYDLTTDTDGRSTLENSNVQTYFDIFVQPIAGGEILEMGISELLQNDIYVLQTLAMRKIDLPMYFLTDFLESEET